MIEFGFRVCRVCLTPENAASLTSLVSENGENFEVLQLIAGIDVSKKNNLHYDAMHLIQF